MNLYKQAISLASAATSVVAGSASALTLTAVYTDPSIYQSSGGQLFSGDPMNGAIDVTSTFRTNVDAAFTYLQNSIKVDRNLEVTFSLFDFTGLGADGDSSITSRYNDTNLPASSRIRLDSSANSHFYLDATPFDNSEWNMTFTDAVLGGGTVNVGRFGTAVVGGGAEDRTDILTLLLHELVHSTALNSPTPEGAVGGPSRLLTIPSALTGLPSDFDLPFLSQGAHIDPFVEAGVYAHTITSEPSFGNGDRWLPTGVELYGICVVQLCTASQVMPNLMGPTVVAEPGTWSFFAFGFGLIAALRSRGQSRA